MKNHIIFLIAFFISGLALAQTDSTKVKKENLLDIQTHSITSILGIDLDGNKTGKSIGFIELLEKSNLTEEEKLHYKNSYYLQAKELNQKQKDSINNLLIKKLNEARSRD